MAYQRLALFAIFRKHGDSQTAAEKCLTVVEREWFDQILHDLVGHQTGIVTPVYRGQHDDELVATQSRKGIAFAQGGLEPVGNLL